MTWISTIAAGLSVGWLINYFADVLPPSRRLTQPRCGECSRPFTLRNYLLSLKCPACGACRAPRFWIVLAAAVVTTGLLARFPWSIFGFWASLPMLVFLGVIVVIDIEHHLVLMETSLFGLALCFVYGILLHDLTTVLLGALGAFLVMLSFYLLGVVFSRVVSALRKKGLKGAAFGFGDVFAGTFLGMLTGFTPFLGVVLIALLTFGACSLIYLLVLFLSKRYQAFANALPFVPFLVFGVVVIFYLP